jgi:hypothetical protein
MSDKGETAIVRDLAMRAAEVAAGPVMDERRDLWRRHHAFEPTRPPVYCRWIACRWEVLDPLLQCRDPLHRMLERMLRERLLQHRIGDDFVIEPWVEIKAVHVGSPPERRWGPPIRHSERTTEKGSWTFEPALKDEADIDRLIEPNHEIDEPATARWAGEVQEALGDALPVFVDRSPRIRSDISHEVTQLVGLEQLMWHMVDRPKWLHRVMAFLRDGMLKLHRQAEQAGHWRLANHYSQAMPYAADLPDPSADGGPVGRDRLWHFMASQETTLVSPAMFDEFILQYQVPILTPFGLTAYGCCEDLTRKIDCLRKIPNLRRIAVTPWADVAACAEQIGHDYVMSWRPSPAEMVCTGFDAEKVRKLTREGLEAAGDCQVDITLKDVETVGGDFNRLVEWARATGEVAEEFA